MTNNQTEGDTKTSNRRFGANTRSSKVVTYAHVVFGLENLRCHFRVKSNVVVRLIPLLGGMNEWEFNRS
jgi:hypothetical protein